MAAKKADKKILRAKPVSEQQVPSTPSSWLDYFRFGESYTSLVLGIVVVIITTILLVFLVRDRNVTQMAGQQKTSSTQTTNQDTIAQATTPTPRITESMPTAVPPTATPVPTKIVPTRLPTTRPTARPTQVVRPTATLIPTRRIEPTKAPQPTAVPQIVQGGRNRTHVVVAGDSLWQIAEKYYLSGYNWTDIARANNLSNPGLITTGTKLVIPNAKPKLATLGANSVQSDFGPKISGTTYTVQKGDHLWGIAVRAYGDGFKWAELARINNITTPSIIHAGLVLKVPRTGTGG